MKKIQSDYGSDKVAWVFRHFPLVQLHPDAERHAEAAECVASLKGPQAFFDFIAAVHAAAPDEQKFNSAHYDSLLPALGVDQKAFEACRTAGTFAQHVADDAVEAQAAGAQGTPFLVVIGPDGVKTIFKGAASEAQMKQLIDTSLAATAKK